jgi:hypothetical protein
VEEVMIGIQAGTLNKNQTYQDALLTKKNFKIFIKLIEKSNLNSRQ